MVITWSSRPSPPAAGVAVPLALGTVALHTDGCLREARQHFAAAYRAAERAGDAESMAAAATGLGGLWVHEHRGTAATAEVQRRQLRALAVVPVGSPWELELRLRLAAEADYVRGRHDDVLDLVAQARWRGDDTLLTTALSLAHHCLLGPENTELRGAVADALVLAAAGSTRRSERMMALLWRTVDRFLRADARAERSLAELDAALETSPTQAVAFAARALRVMLAIRAGRLAEAEHLAAACMRLGEECGDVDAAGWFSAQLTAIRWYQGRIGEMLPRLRDHVTSPDQSDIDSAAVAALAVAAAGAGDERAAAGALARLGGGDPARLTSSSTVLVTLFGAAEAADLLGDATVAARLYELLLPHRHLPIMVSLAVACFGSAEHALGVASLTLGDPDRAVGHLTRAVRGNLALNHWPAAVHSRRRLGQALLARGAPGDAALAREHLARAAAEAAELGMRLPAPRAVPAPAPAVARPAAPSPAGPAPTGPAPAAPIVLRRRGREWQLEVGGRCAVVEHTVGMLHLAQLLARPGVEIPATELAAGRAGTAARTDPDSDHPVLDATARREYRDRLARLDAEVAATEDAGGTAPSALLAERAWLRRELAAGTGLGRRPRQFTDNAERARIAVGKAVRRALDRVTASDDVLGAHLRASIRTGTRCCYAPELAVTLGTARRLS